jgi:hypothetical protein
LRKEGLREGRFSGRISGRKKGFKEGTVKEVRKGGYQGRKERY